MTFLQLEIQPFLQLKKVPISSENINNIMYISRTTLHYIK